MLADPAEPPVPARRLTARVCWMSEQPVQVGARLGIKHTTRWARAIVDGIVSKVDVDTLEDVPADGLRLNDLALVERRLSAPLVVDRYAANRATGAFVLVDESTNNTVAAGMLLPPTQ
jgi:sulfate adenylyltransferase subunit 1